MQSFDVFADRYREIINKKLSFTGFDSDYFAEEKISIVAREAKFGHRVNILDLGCGIGKLEECLCKHFNDFESVGIDISEKSIDMAKSKNIPNCSFKVYDGRYIPFKDNTFHIVIIASVLHHIEAKLHVNLLREVYRVLDVNGYAVIFEHNPLNPFTKYIVKTCEFDKNVVLLKYKYTLNIGKLAGFEAENMEFINFFPNRFGFKYALKKEHYLGKIPLGGQYFVSLKK